VALAVGAPAGWLLIRLLEGVPLLAELEGNPALYIYMFAGTAIAFGTFGLLLGEREARVIASNERLAEVAVTDSLTGLRTARYLHARLEEAGAARTGRPLAIAVIDLDHFKAVNDRYGHPVGDRVLVNAAAAIAATTREGETEARVGGEEFALLLPDNTGRQAWSAAERVRRAIGRCETPLELGEPLRVTASAGVASTAELPGVSVQELYRAADGALYAAKAEGRNRTVVAAARRDPGVGESARLR
jgi:diguanylate cyclase (GGDEF)-like protein